MLKNYGFNILKDIEFSDHYNYTNKDIIEILKEAKKLNCKIITTEKDYLRMANMNLSEIKFIKSDLKIIEQDKLIRSLI